MPLPHAFNKVNENYIDITLEFAMHYLIPAPVSEPHYSVIELFAQELADCVRRYGTGQGDIITRYIMNKCNIPLEE